MLEVYVFDVLTGQRLTPLPVTTARWTVTTNRDERIEATLLDDSVDAAALQAWQAAIPGRSGVLCVADGLPVAAGPIWRRNYRQGERVEITAGGLRSYFDRRILLPVAARTQDLVNANGEPNAALDTSITGVSLGTIAKRYVELAAAWPGGNLPIVLPADEPADRERNVLGVEVKRIGQLLENLSNVIGGPDIAFRPQFTADGLGIEWRMSVGTEAQPRLGNANPSAVVFTVGGGSSAFALNVTEDATSLAEEAWAVGGDLVDRVLASRARDTTLNAAGYPLYQTAVTGLNDVTQQETVTAYAEQAASLGRFPSSFWTMTVRSAPEVGQPRLGDYWLGDLVTLQIYGNPVIPDGDYVRRIASISGDAVGDVYSITFAEALT